MLRTRSVLSSFQTRAAIQQGSPLRSWIDGRFVEAAGSVSSPSGSPSTEPKDDSTIVPLVNATTQEVRAHWQPATTPQVKDAITSAKTAQAQDWYSASMSPMDRANVLRTAARLIQERAEDIAIAESEDTGRCIQETRHEAPGAADCLNYFAGVATSVGGQYIDLPNGGGGGNSVPHDTATDENPNIQQQQHSATTSFGYTRREPLGVAAGIGAWNYPLQSAVWKSAPALAFGNAIVFKPSELTPSTALMMAEIYQEAGVPDGVFQVLLGDGATVGSALASDPRISKISFTGSVATGQKIYQQAAQNVTKTTLELGGKSPLIVFEDCANTSNDLDDAVTAAMVGNWYSSGQVCSNATRVFVQDSIMPQFLDRLVERTKKLRIGDAMDETTEIGPMITQQHMEKVQHYIDVGCNKDGATLLYGGARLPRPGWFLEPAIFTDCRDDMQIVQDEIFGMVMSVLSFQSEAEVIQRANDTTYGLAAGVFTNDIRRAHRVVAQLEAGTTYINNYNLAPVELPWSGYKHSGLGAENGLAGIESWTKMKSVYVEMDRIHSPYG